MSGLIIVQHETKLFSFCILQSVKTAKVALLFKSGADSNPCNYRPISVLSILSKMIERHMHDCLYTFLDSNNLVYSRQSGFGKEHSTETALIKINDDLLFNLDKDMVSGMILGGS